MTKTPQDDEYSDEETEERTRREVGRVPTKIVASDLRLGQEQMLISTVTWREATKGAISAL